MRLYVVRHAQVHIKPHVAPKDWALSQEGIVSTGTMMENEHWPDVSVIYHSPEKKAEQTEKSVLSI